MLARIRAAGSVELPGDELAKFAAEPYYEPPMSSSSFTSGNYLSALDYTGHNHTGHNHIGHNCIGNYQSALNVMGTTPASSVTHLYGQLLRFAESLNLLVQPALEKTAPCAHAGFTLQVGYQPSVGMGGQHRQRGAYLDIVWAITAYAISTWAMST